jgi:hypothetical protein
MCLRVDGAPPEGVQRLGRGMMQASARTCCL